MIEEAPSGLEIDMFPAIKEAVCVGIAVGLHKLYTETTEPTYEEAQEYVIGNIKAALDKLKTEKK